jgi:site-specific DNA-methyltransferase (adenine-specific)
MTFEGWKELLKDVISLHFDIMKPGGFLVINIADILCFQDPNMPKIQALTTNRQKYRIEKDAILAFIEKHPDYSREQIAKAFGCSEQTIDRRLNGNNIRGGKSNTQTRVKIVGGLIENMGASAGFYLYDRRIWVKDPAWANNKWHSLSYRSVDEFEYLYIFWKPGITKVDRKRIAAEEWKRWGSRAVWHFPSVRANNDHEAKFPLELPRRVIKLFSDPGEIILDCFIGSGTTALAAIEEKRNYIGIDIQPKYVKLAKRAVDTLKNTPRLF